MAIFLRIHITRMDLEKILTFRIFQESATDLSENKIQATLYVVY